jgi:hypothetical protein
MVMVFSSCWSDKAKFDYLREQYPNCDILSNGEWYYAVDTTQVHGAIYEISFYYSTNISTVNRLR